MAIIKTGPWLVAHRILANGAHRYRRALAQAVAQEAQLFRRRVVEGFRDQAPGGVPFKPLAATTLKLRRFKGFGGTKALIVRGDLRNSITARRAGEFAYTVGVHRGARGRSGQDLVNVARVHEFGATVVLRITPKMRRFLAVALKGEGGGNGGGGGGIGIIVIRIPPRPFLRPVADRWFNGSRARDRFLARVARNMGGAFGTFAGGLRER
jgi:Phage virion morphogenesis family